MTFTLNHKHNFVSSNTVMEGFRKFLESSTIHGLTYISTTRRVAKVFWILVVMMGFVGAGLLIKESFKSWSESPVKTNIETLPISKIKLPKVTVCPPRNTFTDLNYDLMMTENMTWTEEMKIEMFVAVINADIGGSLSKLHEENRFYKWYYGYSRIESTYVIPGFHLYSDIHTAATSGVVSTQYYGQQFMSELVDRKISYNVYVYPPESIKFNENVTMHLSLEKVSLKGLTADSRLQVSMSGCGYLDADQTTTYTNFTPPETNYDYYDYKNVVFNRDVSSEDVEQVMLDVMPGFRLSWWYTGAEVTPDRRYKDYEMTKHFVR